MRALEPTAEAMGLTNVFVGIIVVAIIGNAAAHSSAEVMAIKDYKDLALGIAIGSSIQVALSVIIVGQISQDGEANWLEGLQLLSKYAIMAIVFFPSGRASQAQPVRTSKRGRLG